MGQYRLKNFRTLLSGALGNTGLGNDMLDLWINLGYVDVMTALRHKNLLTRADIYTAKGISTYPLPCDLLGIDSVAIFGTDETLIRGEPRNLRGHSRSPGGRPQVYTRVGNELEVWPVPNAEFRLDMWFFKELPLLCDPNDTTGLPSTWDPPLYYFSVYHGISALGKLPEEQAITWLQRGQSWFQRHQDDDDFGSGDVTLPVNVVTDFADLRSQHRLTGGGYAL